MPSEKLLTKEKKDNIDLSYPYNLLSSYFKSDIEILVIFRESPFEVDSSMFRRR